MLEIHLCVRLGCAAAQEIAAMNGIDDPAAERANREAENHHGKAGNGFLGNQQESRIAHGRGQGRDNTAKGQASGDILRHHDDRTAASGKRTEARSHRHLPDGVAPQHGRRIDIQRTLKTVDDQEGRRDKRADLKVGIGNRGKDDVEKLALGSQHQNRCQYGRRQNGKDSQVTGLSTGRARPLLRFWLCCDILVHHP